MTTLTIDKYDRVEPGLCPNCHAHSNFEMATRDFLWPHAVPSRAMSDANATLGPDGWLAKRRQTSCHGHAA
ncbi:hypothetical protein [Kitasatospora sp. NPDC096204]|uniref:hypothetical protein n=1 Tax=Kitasatospora sp. NPDC096204 TaxID=3364094 RepID=UPI0037FDC656